MKKIKKIIFSDILIGFTLTLLVLAAFFYQWYPLETLEYKIYDLASKFRMEQASSPVVIVAIDDESITKMGRWPWPRSYIAYAIELLHEYGVKVVGLNILYSEKDSNQGLVEVRNIIQHIENNPQSLKNSYIAEMLTSLKEAEKRLDNDAIFSSSITNAKNIVLPLFFIIGSPVAREEPKFADYLKKNSLAGFGKESSISAQEITPPIQEFAENALSLGHINLVADADGSIRSEPLFIYYGNRLFPSLSLQMVLKYLNYDMKDVSIANGVRIKDKFIPTCEKNKLLISYNTHQSFPYLSFFDLVNNKIPPDIFKNKIVLIGHSATGLGVLQVTPAGYNLPSVEIIANVIENILNKNYTMRHEWAFYIELGIIGFFGIFLSIIIPRLKAGISAVVSLLLLLIWNGAGIAVFVLYGYWFKIFYPTLLFAAGYTVLISKRYLFTEKTKELIEADSIETNKMLGLSFQGQGMLDMAFDKFRKCPVEDDSVKELIYNLGLDFERKRMFNKAIAAYEHILQSGDFKDIQERIKKLKVAGETVIFGKAAARKDATVLVESTETKPTLGRYEVIKELGRGAMGTVYLGKDPKINREVAIKTLRYDEIDEEQVGEVKKRFFREAEAAGKLTHPNIVTIYDVGEDYDLSYMAMELLDGTDLTGYCQKDNLLPVREVLRIISSVAGALDYAHLNGIVHRDIKPNNIMLLKNKDVKVTDFGIARVMASSKTQTGVILGTPNYMSPEQIAGQKVDGRSDLFSLGVVFYELLTGEKPFKGDSLAALMYSITSTPPVPPNELKPGLPDCCVAIINKLLVRETDKRYQHGRDVVNDIAECVTLLNVLKL
jgi:serine/threonine-protein kinase